MIDVTNNKSPLAPAHFPDLPPVAGLTFASGPCQVKYVNKTDVLLAQFAPGTVAAGVFTKSKTAAAPVDWCRAILSNPEARGLVVNSGNANAFTGRTGVETVEAMAACAAGLINCKPVQIYIAQTGVIGEPVAVERITDNLPGLYNTMGSDWAGAAAAICTTDTYPKGAVRTVECGDKTVTIAGIAKGSGMIAPDMATMLGFIFTDAAISKDSLQSMLVETANKSFNANTVDSDTSTSDTVLAFATGQAGNDPSADIACFKDAFQDVLLDLAHQIVRDGEGATKFVEITVRGAESDRAAKIIGLAIANSPLVKTAIAGEDANWGRVVMAVGKSGEAADRDNLAISIGGIEIAKKGSVIPGYDEAPVAQHMKGQDIIIDVDVGVGGGQATVWTCDLTHGYISINADYRS